MVFLEGVVQRCLKWLVRWGIPGVTWGAIGFGLLVFGLVWVVVVEFGGGVRDPGSWNTGSWQAVATGLAGFALVVFASMQVAVMRQMWREE